MISVVIFAVNKGDAVCAMAKVSRADSEVDVADGRDWIVAAGGNVSVVGIMMLVKEDKHAYACPGRDGWTRVGE